MMAVAAITRRRGACPGLSSPMPTGDGLLVRLQPVGTIPLDAFAELCGAARRHGNGIIEITARGSIQVRGLTAASAPRFADTVAALNIAAAEGIAIVSNPLAGLDPEEILDAAALARDLRETLMKASLAARLGAKASVVVDGAGALGLDAIAADIRMRADLIDGAVMLRLGIGGDGASAVDLGIISLANAVNAAVQLLEVVAQRGREARARDIVANEGMAPFRTAVADLLQSPQGHEINFRLRGSGQRADPIGIHRLRDGWFACGIGLAFGHAEAATLRALIESAGAARAVGVRAAPSRALMIIGLSHEAHSSFVTTAQRLGFIVRTDDPRRRVVACAGAPICASAYIAARAVAPVIAEKVAPFLDGSRTIHISGCAKGCAHPAAAALTAIGTPHGCALVADGTVRDTAFATVATDELPAAMERYAGAQRREANHV